MTQCTKPNCGNNAAHGLSICLDCLDAKPWGPEQGESQEERYADTITISRSLGKHLLLSIELEQGYYATDGKGKEHMAELKVALNAQPVWISADNPPTESGEYLCMVTDDREDESDDEWPEVVEFKASKAFESKFICCNFDRVVRWKPING